MYYADNDEEAKAVLIILGLLALAIILTFIVVIIYKLYDYFETRRLLKEKRNENEIHKNKKR